MSTTTAAAGLETKWGRLRARIEAHAALPGRRYSLASKRCGRRRVWQLRYYERGAGGARVQRAVYVGAHPELARRARALLDASREEWLLARETALLARLAAAAGALARRGAGGLPRRKRRSG